MLYIKNGTIIDPVKKQTFRGNLVIENKKIAKIITCHQNVQEETIKISEATTPTIDATGLMIAPGLADTHVHFRDPGFTYKEDIFTGAEAAKKGGFTELVLMANTKPTVDNPDTLQYIREKGHKTGIHIETCANISMGMKGEQLVNMEELSQAGAVGFTDDGIPLLDEKLVLEAMKRAAKLYKPISFHEEDPKLITNNGINAGKASDFYHIKGSPREAEITLVKRDLELARGTGAKVVIQHISCKETVELLRQAKKQGICVYGEATPHHFTLTEETVIEKGTLAKMNPPLRQEEDRRAIIEGLVDGTIDVIATDHAPHSTEEKERPIKEAPSGIIGLETSLSLGIRELVQKGYLDWPEFISKMSTIPCELYGIPGGRIEIGAPADLVLFDPGKLWKVESFASKSCNSPFLNENLPGVVCYTLCDGQIVYDWRTK